MNNKLAVALGIVALVLVAVGVYYYGVSSSDRTIYVNHGYRD